MASLSSSSLISSRPSAVRRCRRRSRIALVCSAVSLAVPADDTRWRGSSISAISSAAVLAGHSRSINLSRASLASFERADQLDHLVDVGDRDGETDQDVGAVARLAEPELGAPGDHDLAERDERGQHVLEVHHQRTAAVERHHVGAERGLQRREAVELVQHHVGHGLALELDHHAIAVAVGFVAQLGDAFDLLLAHQFGHPLDHRGLVHLVRNFRDDDRFAFLADRLDLDLAAHHDRAAAGRGRRCGCPRGRG